MRWIQGKIPLALSAILVATVVALAARAIASLPPALAWGRGALVAVYLGWIVFEARVARSEVSRPATGLDRGTLELYAAARALTVVLALAFGAPAAAPVWLVALGLGLLALGIALRLYAIRELGRFYSHRVRVADDQTIVDTGPYRVLRHPAYTGMLLAHAGFVVACFHAAAAIALLAVFVPAVVLRIVVEERALRGALPAYADYCRGRARLVPFVW